MQITVPGITVSRVTRAALLLLASLTVAPNVRAECSARSDNSTTALVELYTSEGCSSCPPAERWLNSLSRAGFASGQVIPLAFHVDYWDYLGWKDSFALPRHGQRQKRGAQRRQASTIYTPQVVVAGRDYSGWRHRSAFEHTVQGINASPARVKLILTIEGMVPTRINVSGVLNFNDPQQRAVSDIFLAVYESGLSTRVDRGENAGRRLAHDFVVRHLLGPIPADELDNDSFKRSLVLEPQWQRNKLGVAAFVEDRRSGEILQALSLAPCG
jgi:hypothetical protein